METVSGMHPSLCRGTFEDCQYVPYVEKRKKGDKKNRKNHLINPGWQCFPDRCLPFTNFRGLQIEIQPFTLNFSLSKKYLEL